VDWRTRGRLHHVKDLLVVWIKAHFTSSPHQRHDCQATAQRSRINLSDANNYHDFNSGSSDAVCDRRNGYLTCGIPSNSENRAAEIVAISIALQPTMNIVVGRRGA
jgi:hypothetical protein